VGQQVELGGGHIDCRTADGDQAAQGIHGQLMDDERSVLVVGFVSAATAP